MNSIIKIFILSFLYANTIVANNVQLSNVFVTDNPANNVNKIIHFDISWENSWRKNNSSPNNYDGAWVFFKFKDMDGSWQPIRFTGNNVSAPVGTAFEMGNNASINGVGIFIFRSTNGVGTFTTLNFEAGINNYPGTFEVRGFAIEMVHIPEGNFQVGDGDNLSCKFTDGVSLNPFTITTGTINIGTSAGDLNAYVTDGFSGNLSGFPKGFNAFWMMKYELSAGGYRDFLNTLTYAQQANRFYLYGPPYYVTGSDIDGFTDGIEIVTPGSSFTNTPAVVGVDADDDNIFNEITDGEWNVYKHVTYEDCAAYLDWAGLRIMTELEYEKACRGPLPAVLNEYAWGSTSIGSVRFVTANNNLSDNSITNLSTVNGNALYADTYPLAESTFKGLRAGIFATATSSRVSSGAGYYGVMELSGSQYELVVPVSNEATRSYNGKHGDGVLTALGNANENNWPGVNGNTISTNPTGNYDGGDGVRTNGGVESKGGHYNSTSSGLKVSTRCYGQSFALYSNNSKGSIHCIRGVRDSNP